MASLNKKKDLLLILQTYISLYGFLMLRQRRYYLLFLKKIGNKITEAALLKFVFVKLYSIAKR